MQKVFFSDDGSTALEVALKLAYEFTRRTRGPKARPRFLSLEGAYHGDTVGAVALGHIDLFHKAYSGLLFKTDKVMSPFCYRCPFNRARPERADAREYRKCNWECVGAVEQTFSAQKKKGNSYAAFVFEPVMQGAAGMIPQPETWLKKVSEIARANGALLIADEVMTGFGRTGVVAADVRRLISKKKEKLEPPHVGGYDGNLFACHHENVQPDFLCLAKGLDRRLFADGRDAHHAKHLRRLPRRISRIQNVLSRAQLHRQPAWRGGGAGEPGNSAKRKIHPRAAKLENALRDELKSLWQLPNVGDIRQVGLMAGIELVKDWRTREPFDPRERAGIRVCEAMARRGVLTRPVGNVIVLMPPYCTTPAQLQQMISALREGGDELFPVSGNYFFTMPSGRMTVPKSSFSTCARPA